VIENQLEIDHEIELFFISPDPVSRSGSVGPFWRGWVCGVRRAVLGEGDEQRRQNAAEPEGGMREG
jgi:hypothetical protein